jgi:hypothetical protein
VYGAQGRESPGGDHPFAATPAAVADKVHTFSHVFAKLHQVVLVGDL